ncbi:acetate--CoA ligase family protein [Corticibacterium sp. UT-5YL-CI-8]|nr:acetate--CoA ligase family protein [Tianweitania sp. UT-5YL-CI-8]
MSASIAGVARSSAASRLDLTKLFAPRAIAVVGATDAANAIGGMPMRYLTEFGYAGKVYPVNPKRETLMGLTCYASLLDVPAGVDVVLVAVAAKFVPDIIRQCSAKNIPFAVVLSAGFHEAGPEGQLLEEDLLRALKGSGVRMVGPNCLGLLNVSEKVHNGFGAGLAEKNYHQGPVAMVTQSGGYGFTLIKNAHRAGAGFQYVASIGNSLDLNVLDFIEYFLESPDIKVVSAFVEGVDDGRRLVELGKRALEVGKPILIWKAGKTAAGQKAAASHTASLAASYALYQAAFREGGYVEVDDFEDFVDISRAFLASGKLPEGKRVGIVTGSGGAGVVASDRCEEAGLELPPLSQTSVYQLEGVLPEFAAIGNPVDISGQRTKDGSSVSNRAAEIVIADPGMDMLIVRSRQTTSSPAHAEAMADIRDKGGKPVFVAMGADEDYDSKAALDRRGVSWHLTVGRAAVAAAALADFAEKRRKHLDAKDPVRRGFEPGKVELPLGAGFMSEWDSRKVLDAYGIASSGTKHLSRAEVAKLAALDLKFPVAVKANSVNIPHKSEAGAIRLDVADIAAVKMAAADVIASARHYKPAAEIDGVIVQEMASGLEVIVGAVNDACFGPVVLFGLGGVFAEVMKDVTYRFAPIDKATARSMIEEIRGAKLLSGYRGQAKADLDALADIVSRLSWLVADQAERIDSIDINPIFVNGSRLSVADALVVLRDKSDGQA